MTALEIMTAYAMRLAGTPYKWGGNHALEGFDCSGLVLEILKAGGLWSTTRDASAQGIYDELRRKGAVAVTPSPGALAFYGPRTAIVHVAFCLSATSMIEAGGGDRHVTDRSTATARGAVVRVRSIKARLDFLECLSPW